VEIDRELRALRSKTPVPGWVKTEEYQLALEREIRVELQKAAADIEALEEKKVVLHEKLMDAGNLRGLLFETGHALENAVLEALRVLGFKAENYKAEDSEFDVVFVSPDGARLLREAEGKDSKAINIDKMDQLERNIREEFALREGTDYAKGVLFGNANRLSPISERNDFFTQKCKAAAARSGVALVRTPDLFEVAKYLKEHQDSEFARQCRAVILSTAGDIVRFPALPIETAIVETAQL
jgi:hypothetical protein